MYSVAPGKETGSPQSGAPQTHRALSGHLIHTCSRKREKKSQLFLASGFMAGIIAAIWYSLIIRAIELLRMLRRLGNQSRH